MKKIDVYLPEKHLAIIRQWSKDQDTPYAEFIRRAIYNEIKREKLDQGELKENPPE